MPDFIPRSDAAFFMWSENFDRKINDEPAAYGLTAEQAGAYRPLHAAFAELYQEASQPSTRTSSVVIAKDRARAAAMAVARGLAKIARGNGINEAQRFELGLRGAAGGRRRPVKRPEKAPLVSVVSVVGWRVTVRLRNAESPTRVAKPRGVFGATILMYVGSTPPDDASDWQYAGGTTTTTAEIRLPIDPEAGPRVWITACWVSPTQQPGPTAVPIRAVIPAAISYYAA